MNVNKDVNLVLLSDDVQDMQMENLHSAKATIHKVTTMLPISKNVLFPGQNHLLTTNTEDLTLWLSPERQSYFHLENSVPFQQFGHSNLGIFPSIR